MKKWDLQSKLKVESEKLNVNELVKILLENRGIKTKKEINEFLFPKLETVTPKNLDMSLSDIKKAKQRLDTARANSEQVIVYGDYDVDGITGTAITWETLNKNGFRVMPYIPERADEGYGLSIKGIRNLLKKYSDTKLIITVDNGIVANEAVDYAASLGIDVIITDHHVPSGSAPKAYAIIHSVKICGSAVAYIFSNELFKIPRSNLELVALATVADVMKLTSYNRTLLIHGIKELNKTKRVGLEKLIDTAGIEKENVGVYEIGNMIGPRINAMGRIGSGMDSLRLLCTPDTGRAKDLANLLNDTNIKRQQMTFDSTDHARLKSGKDEKIIVIADESYNQGIVGLISGRITEEFYRPSVVIAKEKDVSKGSARSVKGVNIIELLRELKEMFVSLGGHPGAAGFSIETKKIPEFKKKIEALAQEQIKDELLVRKIKIDLELPVSFLNLALYKEIYTLSPFGFGNPEPVFLAEGLIIENMRFVGADGKHLKLELAHSASSGKGSMNHESRIKAILFGVDKHLNLKIGDKVDVAYSISLNEWNGNKNLELKIKDIKTR